jgi:hypothetical protein
MTKEPEKDGWIEWDGGSNPAPGKQVRVRFGEDGAQSLPMPSEHWQWDRKAVAFTNIVAYQVVK